jgi:hypothetical protein
MVVIRESTKGYYDIVVVLNVFKKIRPYVDFHRTMKDSYLKRC